MTAFKPGDRALIEVKVRRVDADGDAWVYDTGDIIPPQVLIVRADTLRPVLPTLVEPTVAELDALPVGTVMRADVPVGVVEKHVDGRWAEAGWNRLNYASELARATPTWQVLWMPEVEA